MKIIPAILLIMLFATSSWAVELVGINSKNQLITLDPETVTITDTHKQLSESESMGSITYDRNHNIIYALCSSTFNLYAINAETLSVQHLGNLHLNEVSTWRVAISAITYDPYDDILYVAVEHHDSYRKNLWSQIFAVNMDTLDLANVGIFTDVLINSLGQIIGTEPTTILYGIAVYDIDNGIGPVRNSHLVGIDLYHKTLIDLFEFPYHGVYGLARESYSVFYSQVDTYGRRFYAKTDFVNKTFTELGDMLLAKDTRLIDIQNTMLYKNFPVTSKTIKPIKKELLEFTYKVSVTDFYDQTEMLVGNMSIGDIISGQFYYDIYDPSKDRNWDEGYTLNIDTGREVVVFSHYQPYIKNNYYSWYSGTLVDSFKMYYDDYNPVYFDEDPRELKVLRFNLVDNSATVLPNNDKLPIEYNLSDWDEKEFYLYKCDFYDDMIEADGTEECYQISGTIEEIVPLDSTPPADPPIDDPVDDPVDTDPVDTDPPPTIIQPVVPTEPDEPPVEQPVEQPVEPQPPIHIPTIIQPVAPTQSSSGGGGGCFISTAM